MPSLPPTAAVRSHLDSQIGILAELSRKNFDNARRLGELNLNLARDLVDDFYSTFRQLLSSGDPMQLASLIARQTQPFGERLRSYAQQLGELLGGVQVDLTRATENLMPAGVMPDLSRAAEAFVANASMRADPAALFCAFPFSPRYGGNGAA